MTLRKGPIHRRPVRRTDVEILEGRLVLSTIQGGLVTRLLDGVSSESGGVASFSVALASQPASNVTVPLSLSNAAIAQLSTPSVTFNRTNWAAPQVVTVSGVDDHIVTADTPYEVIPAPSQSADPAYNGVASSPVWLTEVNTDSPGISVSAVLSTPNGGSTFTVALTSQPTAPVTIGLSVSDPTIGTLLTPSLSFAPASWNIPQVVTVVPMAGEMALPGNLTVVTAPAVSTDPVYKGLATPAIPTAPAMASGGSSSGMDMMMGSSAGVTVSAASGLVTTMAGGTSTFSVVLNSAPSSTVTIGLAPGNAAEGTLSATSLAFTPTNWNMAQTVTVTGVNDPSATTAVAYQVVATPAASADPMYNGQVVPAVEVLNASQAPTSRQLLEMAARQEADIYIAAARNAPVRDLGDATLNAESKAMTKLFDFSAVTNVAIVSGNWSDPNTWSNQQVPGPNANVWIMPGRTVTIDGISNVPLRTVRDDGTIQFDVDRNTQLKADTIFVDMDGTFLMGTAAAPIMPQYTATVLFADRGPIDRVWDPFALSRGMLSMGTVRVFGAATTGHVALAVAPTVGSTTIRLAGAQVNWKVGDNVVVTGTQVGQDESFTIAGISADGLTVTLDHPALYDHTPPSAGLVVYAANTTRNAVFRSENTVDIGQRGHMMFMLNPDVQLYSAGFYGLGRTDKTVPIDDPVVDANGVLVPGTGTNPRARYSVHFHRTGTAPGGMPAMVVDCAAVDNPGWTFVNHSSDVIMEDNVAYKGMGAQFVTEAGNEIGVMDNNIAIDAVGDGQPEIDTHDQRYVSFDFGQQGHGFWLQGGGVVVSEQRRRRRRRGRLRPLSPSATSSSTRPRSPPSWRPTSSTRPWPRGRRR